MGVYKCIHVYRVCTGMYMCIEMSGCVWVYMDVYMCIGMSMTVHGCVQMCTGLSMGVYECLYHVQESTGFLFRPCRSWVQTSAVTLGSRHL